MHNAYKHTRANACGYDCMNIHVIMCFTFVCVYRPILCVCISVCTCTSAHEYVSMCVFICVYTCMSECMYGFV